MIEFAEAHLFFLVAGLAVLTLVAAVSAHRELMQRRPGTPSVEA